MNGPRRRRVILVRHAPALSRDPRRWPDDDHRPLRPEGKREFRRAARGLGRLLSPEGTVSVSPLTRALQTAELLGRAWRPAQAPSIWDELRPEVGTNTLLARLAKEPWNGERVLVGHEPQVSRFVGYATTGEGVSFVRASKGGAIALDFPERVAPAGGRIAWSLTRGQLGRLGRAIADEDGD